MKKNVAVVCGGYSKERDISFKTAENIINNLDDKLFNKFRVVLEKDKVFFCELDGQLLEMDKGFFVVNKNNQNINFDIAIIAIHGTPGEDGILQSYFDFVNIPYTTVSNSEILMAFDKYMCLSLVENFKLCKIPHSLLLSKPNDISIDKILKKLDLPCFVKPNKEGSSLGAAKVSKREYLKTAIENAFEFGEKILVERFIEGRELSIGVITYKGNIVALPITEIIAKNEFFDYESKYSRESLEITPAKIDYNIEDEVKEKAISIYKSLGMRGLTRLDFILDKKDQLYFLEINTVPGMTQESIIPKQIKAMGINFGELLSDLINQFLNK